MEEVQYVLHVRAAHVSISLPAYQSCQSTKSRCCQYINMLVFIRGQVMKGKVEIEVMME